MTKDLIVQTRDRALAAKALESGVLRFLLEEPIDGLGRVDALRLEGDAIHRNGTRVGDFVTLKTAEDERRVRDARSRRELVVVDTPNWKVIPLENLIAALGGKTRLYAIAHSPDEAKVFLTTLEQGVDGVVVRPKTLGELQAYQAILRAEAPARLKLSRAVVTRVEPVGLGERVCVDTTQLFAPGEGLLVGSGSRGFFLVVAETAESPFVAARPFRVNAGAVHSYVLHGERTTYLSEVRAGQRLYAVGPRGDRREVVVGRAKVETRPLLLVEARTDTAAFNVILQNAETVRLAMSRGRTKSVADLRPGDRVLVHEETGARHFGMKVEEKILER